MPLPGQIVLAKRLFLELVATILTAPVKTTGKAQEVPAPSPAAGPSPFSSAKVPLMSSHRRKWLWNRLSDSGGYRGESPPSRFRLAHLVHPGIGFARSRARLRLGAVEPFRPEHKVKCFADSGLSNIVAADQESIPRKVNHSVLNAAEIPQCQSPDVHNSSSRGSPFSHVLSDLCGRSSTSSTSLNHLLVQQ